MLRQAHRQRWWFRLGLAALLQRQTNRIGMRHTPRQGVGNRRRQFGHAVRFQQLGQRAHRACQRFAAFDRLRQQFAAHRHRLHQMIGAAMRGGLMLVRGQGREVFGDFDLLAAVKTAFMRGDRGLAIEDAHLIHTGNDGERARHAGVRDRIVIQIEAHVRRLAGADGLDLVGREGVPR
jgi:hypothetical protein